MKLKPRQNIFHVIVNGNPIVQNVIQIKNEIIKHVNLNEKIIVSTKKSYSCNPSTCTGDNSKYLIIISDDLKIVYDEIISVMDILSTKMTNTISTNVTSTASINCHSKKTRYKIHCYIFHTALLVIILLLIITIICYHYAKHRSKQKSIDALTL